ncbi:MAG TPA: branched-chain amino acid ABC transporter permease [Dehalococcoidia bacterium]|nr:branched-chain amino acid ABC transporter permease [Dehalococcoidia bacterium]
MDIAQQAINGIAIGSTYALFALGLSLSWGILAVLNMAHGHLLMWGALVGYLVSQSVELPLPALLLLAATSAGAMCLAMEWLAFKRLRGRSASREQMEVWTLVASLGFGLIALNVAERVTLGYPRQLPSALFPIENFVVMDVRITTLQIAIILAALAAPALTSLFLARTKWGLALRTMGHNVEIAELYGANTSRLADAALFSAGALAGATGVLLALYLGTFDFTMGEPMLLKGFAVIILGGVGSIWGSVLGGLGVGVVESLSTLFLPGGYREGLIFGLLVLVLMIRPQGLLGRPAVERL